MYCIVCYVVGMHIHIVPNRGSRPTILLRESYREGKKVKKRTIANLSHLPMHQIELLRAVFQGVDLQPAGLGFVVERSQPHGHVEAVHRMMERLGLPGVIAGSSLHPKANELERSGHRQDEKRPDTRLPGWSSTGRSPQSGNIPSRPPRRPALDRRPYPNSHAAPIPPGGI